MTRVTYWICDDCGKEFDDEWGDIMQAEFDVRLMVHEADSADASQWPDWCCECWMKFWRGKAQDLEGYVIKKRAPQQKRVLPEAAEEEDREEVEEEVLMEAPDKNGRVPYDDIALLWNETFAAETGKSKLRNDRISKSWRETVKARWKDYPDLAIWREQIERLTYSDHHSGRSGEWCANFGWFIGKKNWAKVELLPHPEEEDQSGERDSLAQALNELGG